MITVGIDPDSTNTAIAVISDNDLLEVMVIRRRKSGGSLEMARQLTVALPALFERHTIDTVCVEGQEIYIGKSPAKPDSVLKVAQVTGACVALAAEHVPGCTLMVPKPADWKQQQPKDINQVRTYNHFGFESRKTTGKKPYAVPVVRGIVPGMKHVNDGDWEHLGDALGLARWAASVKSGVLPSRSH